MTSERGTRYAVMSAYLEDGHVVVTQFEVVTEGLNHGLWTDVTHSKGFRVDRIGTGELVATELATGQQVGKGARLLDIAGKVSRHFLRMAIRAQRAKRSEYLLHIQ
jgi:hypothetical protein